MDLKCHVSTRSRLRDGTERMLRRFLSPLTGLDRAINFAIRAGIEPPFVIAGAELAGVHRFHNQPEPKPGSYHIGGVGVELDEALVKTMAETVERYSHFLFEHSSAGGLRLTSYNTLVGDGESVISPEKLVFFSSAQHDQDDFPFQRFSPDATLGWVKVHSLIDGGTQWVPAQLLFLGYSPAADEPWLSSAVTTGTATHTTFLAAVRNALLEIIQIDSAMGHWLSGSPAPVIVGDDRTKPVLRLVDVYFGRSSLSPKFYWLRNPDLPGFTVACVIECSTGLPRVVLGLGCSMELTSAMYSALLEATGCFQLAKINLLLGTSGASRGKMDSMSIMNLDDNVTLYALGENSETLRESFSNEESIPASALPPDFPDSVGELVKAFRSTNKQLFAANLTTSDVRALGFSVARLWSPDTISLCLPSFPPEAHHRMLKYGGLMARAPHPYA